MTEEQVFEALCWYDPRNPAFADCYGDEEDPQPPRQQGCSCDNCFYGRDSLAIEVLRLRAALAEPESEGAPVWTEGICGDGAALLRDGVMVPIEEVVQELNEGSQVRAVLARWGRPAPQPADGEVAASIIELRASAAMLERTLYVVPSNHCRRAALLLERLDRYDQALSAVMPSDFKDWWENSKDEWPDVAAGVIKNLRKREELAWEHVGRLAAQPISVAERLPGPGDCDEEGECYWFDPKGSGAWYQDTYQGNYSHWLPAHALPLPS